MDTLAIALRIVHILSGVLWVGGTALFFLYIEPTINKLGPDAEKFIDELINRRKAPIYFVTISTLTVVAGVILYWRDFGGINTSPYGLALGLGGLAAIIAWLGGNLVIPQTLGKVSAIAAEIRAAGGPPSGEGMARMHAVQQRLRLIGTIDLVLLVFAVVAMASARYLA
ncbi:MAG: hypothetical protein H0V49_04180 [Nocardioidaceae bacterium]|nr:hypothetical protein [Nocardioidaceae bacterium]